MSPAKLTDEELLERVLLGISSPMRDELRRRFVGRSRC